LFPDIEEGIKTSMRQRYMFSRFMYTKLFEESEFGTPAIRDMSYDWPLDTYLPLNGTFLWGKELKVTILVDEKTHKVTDTFEAYFPEARWLDLNSMGIIRS